MDEEERQYILDRIESLKDRHAQLDEKIADLVSEPITDQLHMRRLKKEKLRLKDEIACLEDSLFPDIIA